MTKRTSSIKEKAMTLKSRFFQAKFSTAALAIALLVQVSPAHAEPVTLSCRTDEGSETYTFRINYATGLVEQLAPSGNAYNNRVATATISPNEIIWSIDQPTAGRPSYQTTEHWEGHIDRLSATGWVRSYYEDRVIGGIDITCRQATQKF